MLADFGMCADVVAALTRRVAWRLAHDEDLVASGTCILVICGCSNECKRETFV